jgi:predicted TIM-barrel fold metal-dependent hydrolase
MPTELYAHEFQPRSELVVPEHEVLRAKFPAVDAHNHLPVADAQRSHTRDLDQLIREMDMLNLQTIVNLTGGSGDVLRENLDALDRAYPGRFKTFCNLDWTGFGEQGWVTAAVDQLDADIRAGASGLKIFKSLGLRVRDPSGELVMPDDPRLTPIWEKVAELGVPVLIHTADPVAFFRPLDRFNERWDQLNRRPDWHFHGSEYPSFEDLIAALYRLIAAQPQTTFITAHVGCYPENIGFVSQMMDRYPNMMTDISARIAELGRAPYSARAWFLKHADRILFGTDNTPQPSMYQTHFRFLETADEYFSYSPGAEIPPTGRWQIYGIDLPDEVLKKVYHDNAARLLNLE